MNLNRLQRPNQRALRSVARAVLFFFVVELFAPTIVLASKARQARSVQVRINGQSVNLNSRGAATMRALQQIQGIGPQLAAKVVNGGPYASLAEVGNVLPRAAFQNLKAGRVGGKQPPGKKKITPKNVRKGPTINEVARKKARQAALKRAQAAKQKAAALKRAQAAKQKAAAQKRTQAAKQKAAAQKRTQAAKQKAAAQKKAQAAQAKKLALAKAKPVPMRVRTPRGTIVDLNLTRPGNVSRALIKGGVHVDQANAVMRARQAAGGPFKSASSASQRISKALGMKVSLAGGRMSIPPAMQQKMRAEASAKKNAELGKQRSKQLQIKKQKVARLAKSRQVKDLAQAKRARAAGLKQMSPSNKAGLSVRGPPGNGRLVMSFNRGKATFTADITGQSMPKLYQSLTEAGMPRAAAMELIKARRVSNFKSPADLLRRAPQAAKYLSVRPGSRNAKVGAAVKGTKPMKAGQAAKGARQTNSSNQVALKKVRANYESIKSEIAKGGKAAPAKNVSQAHTRYNQLTRQYNRLFQARLKLGRLSGQPLTNQQISRLAEFKALESRISQARRVRDNRVVQKRAATKIQEGLKLLKDRSAQTTDPRRLRALRADATKLLAEQARLEGKQGAKQASQARMLRDLEGRLQAAEKKAAQSKKAKAPQSKGAKKLRASMNRQQKVQSRQAKQGRAQQINKLNQQIGQARKAGDMGRASNLMRQRASLQALDKNVKKPKVARQKLRGQQQQAQKRQIKKQAKQEARRGAAKQPKKTNTKLQKLDANRNATNRQMQKMADQVAKQNPGKYRSGNDVIRAARSPVKGKELTQVRQLDAKLRSQAALRKNLSKRKVAQQRKASKLVRNSESQPKQRASKNAVRKGRQTQTAHESQVRRVNRQLQQEATRIAKKYPKYGSWKKVVRTVQRGGNAARAPELSGVRSMWNQRQVTLERMRRSQGNSRKVNQSAKTKIKSKSKARASQQAQKKGKANASAKAPKGSVQAQSQKINTEMQRAASEVAKANPGKYPKSRQVLEAVRSGSNAKELAQVRNHYNRLKDLQAQRSVKGKNAPADRASRSKKSGRSKVRASRNNKSGKSKARASQNRGRAASKSTPNDLMQRAASKVYQQNPGKYSSVREVMRAAKDGSRAPELREVNRQLDRMGRPKANGQKGTRASKSVAESGNSATETGKARFRTAMQDALATGKYKNAGEVYTKAVRGNSLWTPKELQAVREAANEVAQSRGRATSGAPSNKAIAEHGSPFQKGMRSLGWESPVNETARFNFQEVRVAEAPAEVKVAEVSEGKTWMERIFPKRAAASAVEVVEPVAKAVETPRWAEPWKLGQTTGEVVAETGVRSAEAPVKGRSAWGSAVDSLGWTRAGGEAVPAAEVAAEARAATRAPEFLEAAPESVRATEVAPKPVRATEFAPEVGRPETLGEPVSSRPSWWESIKARGGMSPEVSGMESPVGRSAEVVETPRWAEPWKAQEGYLEGRPVEAAPEVAPESRMNEVAPRSKANEVVRGAGAVEPPMEARPEAKPAESRWSWKNDLWTTDPAKAEAQALEGKETVKSRIQKSFQEGKSGARSFDPLEAHKASEYGPGGPKNFTEGYLRNGAELPAETKIEVGDKILEPELKVEQQDKKLASRNRAVEEVFEAKSPKARAPEARTSEVRSVESQVGEVRGAEPVGTRRASMEAPAAPRSVADVVVESGKVAVEPVKAAAVDPATLKVAPEAVRVAQIENQVTELRGKSHEIAESAVRSGQSKNIVEAHKAASEGGAKSGEVAELAKVQQKIEVLGSEKTKLVETQQVKAKNAVAEALKPVEVAKAKSATLESASGAKVKSAASEATPGAKVKPAVSEAAPGTKIKPATLEAGRVAEPSAGKPVAAKVPVKLAAGPSAPHVLGLDGPLPGSIEAKFGNRIVDVTKMTPRQIVAESGGMISVESANKIAELSAKTGGKVSPAQLQQVGLKTGELKLLQNAGKAATRARIDVAQGKLNVQADSLVKAGKYASRSAALKGTELAPMHQKIQGARAQLGGKARPSAPETVAPKMRRASTDRGAAESGPRAQKSGVETVKPELSFNIKDPVKFHSAKAQQYASEIQTLKSASGKGLLGRVKRFTNAKKIKALEVQQKFHESKVTELKGADPAALKSEQAKLEYKPAQAKLIGSLKAELAKVEPGSRYGKALTERIQQLESTPGENFARSATTLVAISIGTNLFFNVWRQIKEDGKVDIGKAAEFMATKEFWMSTGGLVGGVFVGQKIASMTFYELLATRVTGMTALGGTFVKLLPAFALGAVGATLLGGNAADADWGMVAAQTIGSTLGTAIAISMIAAGPIGQLVGALVGGFVAEKVLEMIRGDGVNSEAAGRGDGDVAAAGGDGTEAESGVEGYADGAFTTEDVEQVFGQMRASYDAYRGLEDAGRYGEAASAFETYVGLKRQLDRMRQVSYASR
jgi:hypothetical protein